MELKALLGSVGSKRYLYSDDWQECQGPVEVHVRVTEKKEQYGGMWMWMKRKKKKRREGNSDYGWHGSYRCPGVLRAGVCGRVQRSWVCCSWQRQTAANTDSQVISAIQCELVAQVVVGSVSTDLVTRVWVGAACQG